MGYKVQSVAFPQTISTTGRIWSKPPSNSIGKEKLTEGIELYFARQSRWNMN